MHVFAPVIQGIKLASWLVLHGRPRVSYVGGWVGHRNLGDEALFDACRVLFKGISLCPVRGDQNEIAFLRAARAFTSAMLAGGTIINRNESTLLRAQRMRELASHCFVFGAGVAGRAFWRGRELDRGTPWRDNSLGWQRVLESCDYVGIRGPLSQRSLIESGIRNVEVVGDPVLVFAGRTKNMVYRGRTLGLNLGTSGGQMWDGEEQVFEKMGKLASFAKCAGWKVTWFVVWPKDYALTRRVAKESGTDENIRPVYTDYARYLALVSDVSVYVGVKLHAVALATCAGVPAIMLEYRPKCRDYMESIQQGHLCQRVDQFSVEEVWEQVLDMDQDRDRYARELAKGILPLKSFQQRRAHEVAEKIERIYREAL